MKKLVLARNDLNDTAGAKIADAMVENTSIIFLSLGGNKLGDKGVLAFEKVLKENTTLTNMRLRKHFPNY